MKRTIAFLFAVALLAAPIAIRAQDNAVEAAKDAAKEAAEQTTTAAHEAAESVAEEAKEAEATAVKEAEAATPKATYAIFLTTEGNFVAKLEAELAPLTCSNFVALANGEKEFTNRTTGEKVKEPYFDGSKFHRIVTGFVIQGGAHRDDPKMQGPGYSIKLETTPKLKHDRAGTLSMARTPDPNSASSQFFVTLAPTPALDAGPGSPGYAAFGYVVEGLDAVMRIGEFGSSSGAGTPKKEIRMTKVVIVEGTPADYEAKLAELTGGAAKSE